MKHTTYLVSDKTRSGHGEIIIELPGKAAVQVSGKKAGNLVIREAIELYLDDLSFAASGLAEKWTAFADGDERVVIDPSRRLGEPFVASCGHTARTLWEASLNEGGIVNAALAYDVPDTAVKIACKFYDHLKNTAV